MSYSLGVHLGTTSVVAAAANGPHVQMINLSDHRVTAAAAVYLRDDGMLIAGDPAVRMHPLHPDRVVREVRRRLGDPTPILLGGTAHAAPALLACLVDEAVGRATTARGDAPDAVVLTHPASWGPFRRELFDEVRRLAEAPATRSVTEAEAAATYYWHQRPVGDGETIVFFHMGGGTCEITVLRRATDGFAVLGVPKSVERLGGTDIDEAILRHIDRAAGGALAELDTDGQSLATRVARLHHDCVLAKEALSVDTEAVVSVQLPDRQVEVRLNRSTLEDLIRPLLEEALEALRRALAAAEVSPDELSAVFLTGGSTRIPLVGRMISDLVRRPVVLDQHPEFVIAVGAARLAQSHRARPRSTQPDDLGFSARRAMHPVPTGSGRGGSAAAAPGVAPPVEPGLVADRPAPPRLGDAKPSAVARSPAVSRQHVAHIVVAAVVAVLVLVGAVITMLVVMLGFDTPAGGHPTSTFIQTVQPTSGAISGHA